MLFWDLSIIPDNTTYSDARYLKYNKSYRIPILAAILDFEHEGVVRNHVSSNEKDPWSQKHTIRHQNHLSIWN